MGAFVRCESSLGRHCVNVHGKSPRGKYRSPALQTSLIADPLLLQNTSWRPVFRKHIWGITETSQGEIFKKEGIKLCQMLERQRKTRNEKLFEVTFKSTVQ